MREIDVTRSRLSLERRIQRQINDLEARVGAPVLIVNSKHSTVLRRGRHVLRNTGITLALGEAE